MNNVSKRFAHDYTKLIDIPDVVALLGPPIETVREEPLHLVPSIRLTSVGPVLNSILALTENYLLDIRAGRLADYDFMDRTIVLNYRVRYGVERIEVASGDDRPAKIIELEAAEVRLTHGWSQFTTVLTFVGESRKSWLDSVFSALQPTCVLRPRVK